MNENIRNSQQISKLCTEVISAHTKAPHDIIVFDEIDSTNNYAKKSASDGALSGTVIIADRQSNGRGRLGRNFISPPASGLYMSVILRPDFGVETAQLLTPCAAVAAAEAVEALSGCKTDIKWVNDLYMNDRKICGILTESSIIPSSHSLDYVIIGIGINVLSVKNYFDAELLAVASSIEDECGVILDRNCLCAEVLNRLDELLTDIESRRFLEEYRRREILTGNLITATAGGASITGKALEIDQNANIVVELGNGTTTVLSSGEANLCRLKKD